MSKQKYLKYKQKYLNLKKQYLNRLGFTLNNLNLFTKDLKLPYTFDVIDIDNVKKLLLNGKNKKTLILIGEDHKSANLNETVNKQIKLIELVTQVYGRKPDIFTEIPSTKYIDYKNPKKNQLDLVPTHVFNYLYKNNFKIRNTRVDYNMRLKSNGDEIYAQEIRKVFDNSNLVVAIFGLNHLYDLKKLLNDINLICLISESNDSLTKFVKRFKKNEFMYRYNHALIQRANTVGKMFKLE